MGAPNATDQMQDLLRYANYRKVGDALGVTKEAVSAWARGQNVTPYRVTQVRELMRRIVEDTGQHETAAPPKWAGRLEESIEAIARRVGVTEDDREAVRVLLVTARG
jgi:predicted AAA+ superfamily ATPase